MRDIRSQLRRLFQAQSHEEQMIIQDGIARDFDALQARTEKAEEMVEQLIYAGKSLSQYAYLVSADHPRGDGEMALFDKNNWDAIVAEWQSPANGEVKND